MDLERKKNLYSTYTLPQQVYQFLKDDKQTFLFILNKLIKTQSYQEPAVFLWQAVDGNVARVELLFNILSCKIMIHSAAENKTLRVESNLQ